jgi:hypothetical protein
MKSEEIALAMSKADLGRLAATHIHGVEGITPDHHLHRVWVLV